MSIVRTDILNDLLGIIISLPNDPAEGRRGGFFTTFEKERSATTLPIGHFPEEKRSRYFRNSIEKSFRIYERKEVRSFLSRILENNQFGGGIYLNAVVCSFSGLPEKLDEVISLIYNIETTISGGMSLEYITEIQTISFSDNEYIIPVAKQYLAMKRKN